jgi:sensor histidine kinase YesM
VARQKQQTTETRVKIELVILAFLGLGVAFAMARYIARNIVGRVAQMVATIQAIAENDSPWTIWWSETGMRSDDAEPCSMA